MSDLDTIKAMLTRAGIESESASVCAETPRAKHAIRVEDGYGGFFTVLEFDEVGALLRVSAWE